MPKMLKNVLRWGALACVGIFLGANIYLWNAQSLTGNALPMPFGVGMAVVLTGSMEPTLMVDDVIIVQEQDSYQQGDVVVFQSGSSLVVHRIVRLNGDSVVTKGDANNAEDSEIAVALIKGAVIGHIGGAGAVIRVLKSPMVSIGMLGLSFYLLERSYRKEKQQNDDTLDALKEEIRRLRDDITQQNAQDAAQQPEEKQ